MLVKVSGDGVRSLPCRSCHRLARQLAAVLHRALPCANAIRSALCRPPDAQLQARGQRVDHRHAHAVQTAGNLVGVLVEFTAGVQLGHDDFSRRNAFLGVDVGRNPAPIVEHRHRTIGVQASR
jgi:hypothetical protein